MLRTMKHSIVRFIFITSKINKIISALKVDVKYYDLNCRYKIIFRILEEN